MEKIVVDKFDPMDLDDLWPTSETKDEDLDFDMDVTPPKLESDPIDVVDEDLPVLDSDEVKETPKKKRRGRPPKIKEVESEISDKKTKKIAVKKKEIIEMSPEIDSNEEDPVFDTIIPEEKPKKRGRPKKAVVAEDEAPPKYKRMSIDDLPIEKLQYILENYSQKPIEKIAEEMEIKTRYIHQIISRFKEIFENEIATGMLSEDKYNISLAPKLVMFEENNSNAFKMVAKNVIKNIM